VANPAHTVTLHVRMKEDGKYESEPMRACVRGNLRQGIRAFDGEKAECWLEEKDGDKTVRRTDPMSLTAADPTDAAGSRYALLCKMSAEAAAGEDKELEKDLENYRQLDDLTKEIFTLI